jgi:hypothetical protein
MNSPQTNWRTSVVENPRGFLCTITNSCQTNIVRKSAHVTSGSWAMMPPEIIPAGSTVQFGAKVRLKTCVTIVKNNVLQGGPLVDAFL